MVETRHVRPTCFVLLSVQGKQLCPYKLNLYTIYLLCFVMSVHISCNFFSLLSLFGGNKEIIIITMLHTNFKAIGHMVLERKIFTIYGHVGYVCHVIRTV